jgi:hypothetical protein
MFFYACTIKNYPLHLCHFNGKRWRKEIGLVVQLVRMPPCHGGGRGFESRPDRSMLICGLSLQGKWLCFQKYWSGSSVG